MSKEALKIISGAMDALELKYGFMEYIVPGGEESPKTYFTGEYQETEPNSEDGLQETQFILNGFSREPWISLENAKEKISKYFNKVSGRTVIAENGSAVAVFYGSSLVIPTEDAELKRIQINLTIKEWSVI
jgi:hypothetical protein